MAMRPTMSDEQFRRFEGELLATLRRDPDHQFAFDGKLRFHSSRYNCELSAVNVHLDERKGDLVLVGAFLSGEPQIDYSRGYALIQHELSVPFKECFEDLKSTPGFNEMYLISKSRKAVIDKCLSAPLRILSALDADRDGRIELGDFFRKDVRINGGAEGVGSLSMRDGKVEILNKDGVPFNISKVSLLDIQRLGDKMLEIRGVIKDAREKYVEGRRSVVRPSATVSERDDGEGEKAGLMNVYDSDFPLRVVHSVAKTYSRQFSDVFDDSKHTAREIDAMVRAAREGRRPFGFSDDGKVRKKTSSKGID